MELALTHRSIETMKEKFMSPLTVEQAAYARDAFSKAVYERMFSWLVERLNSSLENKVLVIYMYLLNDRSKSGCVHVQTWACTCTCTLSV